MDESTKHVLSGIVGIWLVTLTVLLILTLTGTIGADDTHANVYAKNMNQYVGKDDPVRFKNVLVDTSGKLTNKAGDGNRATTRVGHDLHVFRDVGDTSVTPLALIESQGTGDASLLFRSKAVDWSMGVDYNAGTQQFKISRNGALGTNDALTINGSNTVTLSSASNANTLAITNNTITTSDVVNVTSTSTTTGNGIKVTMDAVTTGDMVYLDNGGNTLTGAGSFINCVDDDTTLFRVGPLGATIFRQFTEVITAANVITAAESGTTYFLNSATGAAQTLPAPAAGLHFWFIISTVPTSGNMTVTTNGGDNIIEGMIDVNSTKVPAVNEDTINFIASTCVIGDWARVVSDGTSWFVSGQSVGGAGAITFTAS